MLRRYAIGKVGAWETVVAEVQVHAVVVLTILNHFEGEAHTFGLSFDHVVGTRNILKEFFLRAHDLQFVQGRKRNGHYSDDVLRQRLVVLVDAILHIILVVNHDDERTCLVRVRPGSLSNALIGEEVERTHPVSLQRIR